MITTKSATWHFTRVGIFALVLAALLFGALSFQPTRQAHAAPIRVAVSTCLGVQPRISPSGDKLPFNEVLQIIVTNGCSETLSGTTLAVIDRIRCGTQPWVVDLRVSVGPQTLAPGGGMSWWITGVQTGCPSGETGGPWQQWLHGDASGTGESSGTVYTGAGDAYLNV